MVWGQESLFIALLLDDSFGTSLQGTPGFPALDTLREALVGAGDVGGFPLVAVTADTPH